MDKKQFRKDIEVKLDTAFGHLAKGAEKKFRKLLKKASHLLANGLHKPDPKPKPAKAKAKVKKKKSTPAKSAPKKKTPVKAAKKSASKKK